jgi:hypothetical protein
MPRCARSGAWARTASPARSPRASRRSPGWPPCTPRRRPCGLPADSRVLNGHAVAQGPRREPLLRQRAAGDLRADRAHAHVRPLRAAGLALPREAQQLRVGGPSSARPHASLCAISWLSNNGFTGPIPASITALTRLVTLYAAPPPVRSFGRHSRVLNGLAAAQQSRREPLLRQRAAGDLRADRAHAPVRPPRAAGLAADAAPASLRERSGCAWALHLRRRRMPGCARSGA